MNVLELTGMASTKYGALERYFVNLLQECPSDRFIFVYDSEPQSIEYKQDIVQYGGGGVIYCIPNTYTFNYLKFIVDIIRREHIDIVHFHFGSYAVAPYLRLIFPNLKMYSMIHCEVKPRRNKLKQWKTQLEHSVFDKRFCVSNGVKQEVEKLWGNSKKNEVLYLGVEKRPIVHPNLKADLGIDKEAIVLSCIGFNVSLKGIDLIVKSIAKLLNRKQESKLPPFKVLIVGLKEEQDKLLKSLLDDTHTHEYFMSLGIRNDIDSILNFTDIYLQPSRSEAISMSIVEALNYACPVIATNVGGIPEVVQDEYNGFLFEKGNIDQLSELIYKLLINAQLRSDFGENSLEMAKHYTVKESVKKLAEIYHDNRKR